MRAGGALGRLLPCDELPWPLLPCPLLPAAAAALVDSPQPPPLLPALLLPLLTLLIGCLPCGLGCERRPPSASCMMRSTRV
jgi:hypothetical protein